MSFSPLPKTFLEELHHPRHDTIVELGCGDGAFSELLTATGARIIGCDRRPPWHGSCAQLVADVRQLPFPPASIDLLVCANLLRQIWPMTDGCPVPVDWYRCLRENGRLFIFEDDAAGATPAVRNYRDLQAFLVRLDPARRRPLLSRRVFATSLKSGATRPGRWDLGWQQNNWTVNIDQVLALLSALDPEGQGEGGRLTRAIRQEGMSYGRYWWACWTPED
ncbi:MAG: class I SAM-dependent methyltransferase [bacterium]